MPSAATMACTDVSLHAPLRQTRTITRGAESLGVYFFEENKDVVSSKFLNISFFHVLSKR